MWKNLNNTPDRSKVFMKPALGRITVLFYFLLIALNATDTYADTLATSAGVYPSALRQNSLRSGLNWLESLHQLLIDHSRATGQTLRLEFTHEPSVNSELALDRARKGLVGLPIELRQRQEACLIAGFYGENQKNKFDISAIEVECGLSLTQVPVNGRFREVIDSLSGKSLGRKAWEAYIFWIGLEILRACESPVLESQALNDQRMEQFPSTLRPVLERWRSTETSDSDGESVSQFMMLPEDYGEESQLGSWSVRVLELGLILVSVLGVGLLVILMRALRRPIYLISASGRRTITGMDRLSLIWAGSDIGEKLSRFRLRSQLQSGRISNSFEVIDD